MPDRHRAVVLMSKPTWWVVEHRADTWVTDVITGWMPIVEGAEVIERVKRDHGAENVVEWDENDD